MPPPPEQEQRYNGMSHNNELLQQINIAVIRVDLKVDNLGSRVTDLKDSVNTKFKEIEDRQKEQAAEIKELRERPYVSPGTVWKVIGTLLSVIGLVATIMIAVLK